MPSSSETSTSSPTRELAAIMFSDIAGYTAIMGRDEQEAMRALDAHRGTLRTLLPKFNGRLIGEIGDGTLSSFHSALDAVNCAREVQALAEKNPELKLRIGIHLGDVVFTNNTVVGDGVNVASRIHALAPPGGICVSGGVYDEIRNKPGMGAKDLGEQALKNVSRPVRVYALLLDGSAPAAAPAVDHARLVRRASIALAAVAIVALAIWLARSDVLRSLMPATEVRVAPGAPVTLAVLPFTNLSGDKNDEYFSDGMTDEIRGDLTKIAGLQVTARTSSYAFKGQNIDASKIASLLHVRNLLEGSVRRSADKVRIEVELIDASSGFSIWSESYDREVADVFAIQSDIAQGVAEKLRVTLLPGEKARVKRKPTDNLEAYNLYLQGNYYGGSLTAGGELKAIDSFSAAIAKDPNFAGAYAARALAYGIADLIIIPPREAVPKIKADVEHALALDSGIGVAHALLAYHVYFHYEWNWPAAEREFQVALKLDPDNPLTHSDYGDYLGQALGRFDDAVREHLRAIELDPQNPAFVGTTALTLFGARRYDQALQYYQQQIAMAPDLFWGYYGRAWTLLRWKGDKAAFVRDAEKAATLTDSPWVHGDLANAYALAGRFDEARKLLRESFEQASKQHYFDPAGFAPPYFNSGDKDRAFELLEEGYQDRSSRMTYLNDPYWDEMRSDPRFTAMVKKVGLPH